MARKTLRVPLRFPDNPKRWSSCAQCIEQRIANRPGIDRVRVAPEPHPGNGLPRAILELDYDPDLLSLAQINRYVEQAGGCLDESMAYLVLPIEGLVSPRGEHAVQAALNKIPGVVASISFASQALRVEFDRRQCALPEIVRQLDRFGIRVLPQAPVKQEPAARKTDHARACCQRVESAAHYPDLLTAIVGGFLLAGAWTVHALDGPEALRLPLLAATYVLCGWRTAIVMLHSLRQLRLDIDLLMFAAAFGAAFLGHYEEGGLLLFLFALGGAGERLAMSRARRAIQALAAVAPQTAIVLDPQGGQREVRVEQLSVGDRLLVRPGQRVPADGPVVAGASAVDQSPITGEAIPVEKTVGDPVYAGSINGDGLLTIQVSKPSSENTIAKIIRMVEEAQSTKSPTQQFTDQVERWYVPIVLITTACLIVIPPLLGLPSSRDDSSWAGWFYQAMAFLTAASPCALAIGTPAAVLSGIGRAARGGVLIKGGVHLENLGRARVVAFDKTGTLTRGRPEVTDIIPLTPAWDQTELLATTAAVERGSQHPLAEALVAEADARECPRRIAERVEQIAGFGIVGTVDRQRVMIGRVGMLHRPGAPSIDPDALAAAWQHIRKIEAQGKTTMVVVIDDRIAGVIGLADQPRTGAAAMIGQLKRLGIRRTIMLTGDNTQTAAAVASQIGIDEYHAELLPQDKLLKVRELDRAYGRVAMVGDGINDAPAMANATVGIAVGGASGGGSDVALETADIALLADDLKKLPEAIGVSRLSRRIIIQNLCFALGVMGVLAPFAAMGYTTIYTAVLFHEGSTVLVVLNALRILAYRHLATDAAEADTPWTQPTGGTRTASVLR